MPDEEQEKKLRVLLVEDNPTDALLLQDELADVRSPRLEIINVSRLRDAVQKVVAEPFDVVLLDLGLPDSHGLETFHQFHHVAPRKPIIVLSGLDDEQVAIDTVHAGAQDYLMKGRVASDLLVRAMRYAIQRKRVEEELRHRNEQFQEDLNMAREFQQAFLPRRYPTFPPGADPNSSALQFAHFYQPSGAVGGDFFTVLSLGDKRAGVFLCDVMGHGVRAALVTAMIRGLVEELKPVALDPGHFITELNQALADVLEETDTTMFASAFYMVIDLEERQLRYSNAGHPPPFHLRPATGKVQAVEPGAQPCGPVLGLFRESSYGTGTQSFEPGDRMFLFTDGLYEVEGREDHQYGMERLLQAVEKRIQMQAEPLFTEVMEEIRAFSRDQVFADDVCMMAVEARG